MDEKEEIRAIACNHAVGSSVFSAGALGYIVLVPGSWERALVFMRSRGGRYVTHWIALKKLTNFRFKTVVRSNPAFGMASGFFNEHDLELLRAGGLTDGGDQPIGYIRDRSDGQLYFVGG